MSLKNVLKAWAVGTIYVVFIAFILWGMYYIYENMETEKESSTCPVQSVIPDNFEKNDASVISVGGWCSGFVIGNNRVLTAKHCIPKKRETFWIYFDNTHYRQIGKCIYKSEKKDIALVEVNTDKREFLDFSKGKPAKYERYFLKGFPSRFSYMSTSPLIFSATIFPFVVLRSIIPSQSDTYKPPFVEFKSKSIFCGTLMV